MKPKTSILHNPFTARSWPSCLPLLMTLVLLGWCAAAGAAQTDNWTGLGAGNSWTNAANWDQAGGVTTGGDDLIFPVSSKLGSTNDFTGLTINSITFSTNGYVLGGNALIINNGITDTAGSNSCNMLLRLGGSQTFQNSASVGTTIGGIVDLGVNNLTIGGSGYVYLNGIVSNVVNGGTLTINNSGVARLGPATGSTGNTFGTNTADAVIINSGGTLRLFGAAGAAIIPNGPTVGNVQVNGTLDLNGINPTVNGLEGSGFVDNLTNAANVTLTVGNGDSNAVFSGVIQNPSAGTVALTKTGYGTQTLNGANSYAGPTTINQGTLLVGSAGSLGTFSQVVTIESGAVLDVTNLGAFGYQPQRALNVGAGTPSKPYTNFWGSYNTNYPTYVIQYDVTNSYTITNPGPVIVTNFYNPSNSIVSIINSDINGNFNVWGGSISPVSDVAPGIATWSIKGNLTLDASLGLAAPYNLNKVNFLLNNTTTPGGGTNDLIAVNGTCYIGDELDFVVSPLTGTLAAGQYTLIQSTNLVLTSPNDGNPASLVLIAPRGISGTFDTSDAKNVKLTASGTATPASLVWGGTSTANNSWDTHVTKDWTNSGTLDWFYSQDNVIFDDTGIGTVTLPIPVTPGSMTFNNNRTNYAFTASSTAFITGTGGLTLNGSGSVTLNNPNNFTGNVTINSGTLILGNYGGNGNQELFNGGVPGQIIFGSGNGTFEINAALNSVSSQAGLAGFTLNSGANAQMFIPGRGSSDYALITVGTNIIRNVGSSLYMNIAMKPNQLNNGVYFTNTIPWTNGLLLGAGWLHTGSDWLAAATNFPGNSPVSGNYSYTGYAPSNNPAFNAANWVVTNNISVSNSTASVTASATINTLRLSGPATVTISSGQTLKIQTGGLLVSSGSAGANTITGGTLEGAAGGDLIVLQNYTSSPFTIGSVIADNTSATALTLGGFGGTVILTNNNTYTGVTYINAGALQVGAGGTLGSIATSSSILDNGTLSFNRSDTTSVGAVSGKGGVTQAGTGALIMTADNFFSGPVTNNVGTLQLGNGGASGSISNAASLLNNGILVVNNSVTVGYPNAITGLGSVVQQGAGTLVFGTNETYSGNTIISNGTVALAAAGSISNTAAILINSGATFDVSALSGGFVMRATAPNEIIAGNGTITGSLTTTNGGKIMPGTNGVIGTLAVSGNLTMKGGNYYFDVGTSTKDQITVGGTLNQIQANVIINATTTLTNGLYPLITATGGVSGSTASLIAIGFSQAGQLAVLTNSTANELDLLVYSGVAPTVTWVGDGSQNLWDETANNWTPALFKNNDQVQFTDTGSANPAVNMDVVVYPSTVTVDSTSKNYTLAGSNGGKISGGASLIKPGTSTSTLTLETLNDYSGVTAIDGGVVQLGDGASAANDGMVGIGNVTNNTTLVATNVNAETLLGNLVGTGTLIQSGAGTLILAGNNTGFSGPILIAANSLQVGNGVSGTLGTGNVTNNGSLNFNIATPGALTVSANISGLGSVTNIGTGTVTLSGTNTYAGRTVIPAGVIALGSDRALPGAVLQIDDNTSPNPVGALDLHGHDVNLSVLQNTNTGIGTAAFEPAQIFNNGSGTNTLVIGGGGSYTFSGQLLDNNNSGSGRLALLVTNGTTLSLFSGYNDTGSVTFQNLFSGGLTISNASVFLGNTAQGIDRLQGQHSAGLGTITLLGGTGVNIDSRVGLPTNAVIYAHMATGNANSGRSEYNTVPTINVPAGQSGSIFLPKYGGISFPLTGSGTLTIQPAYVRGQVSGDWTAFTGTMIFQYVNNANGDVGGGFTITGNNGLPNATLVMHTNNGYGSPITLVTVNISGGTGGNVLPIGALTGGDNTSAIGGGTQGNGSSGGARNTIWAIGSLNLSTTNGSQFLDGGCGIRKVGTGSLTLTNNSLSFGGQCVVSNGTLVLAPAADFIATIATNNYLAGTNITVVAPGILDVSAMGGTLYIGGHTGTTGGNSQTLYGGGTVNGNLVVTNSIVEPSRRASMGASVFTGSGLTVSGSVTLRAGTTVRMTLNRTNSPANDSLSAASIVYGGALVVTNLGDTAFANGSSNVFRLFNITGNTISGAFTSITLPALPGNELWVTNLSLDGSIALVNTSPAINTNPPAMMVSFIGTQLSLGWPTNAGWVLQSQTNPLSGGLTIPSNTWFDVAGSAAITNTVITVNPTNPTVFYRLRLP